MSKPSGRRAFLAGATAAAGCAFLSDVRADASSASFDRFVRSRMQTAHIPGLSLAVIGAGKLLRVAGYGYANLERRRPMQGHTLINIASVTKTVTCTAVMQLQERRRLSLDADVSTYLPFPVRNPAHPHVPITVEQLLTHSASIDDSSAYADSYACGDPAALMGEWLAENFRSDGDPARNFHPWAPGERFAYSNVAFGLLGHIVERLSGMSYPQYCSRHILEPLGMGRSAFLLGGANPAAHATPYKYLTDGNPESVHLRDPSWSPPRGARPPMHVPYCLYSFATMSDGLLRTSAAELARFLMAYLHGGRLHGQRLLEDRTVDLILTAHPTPGAAVNAAGHVQGLAWFQLPDFGPETVWGHTGGDPGVCTVMALARERRAGVVVLANGAGMSAVLDVARQALSLATGVA